MSQLRRVCVIGSGPAGFYAAEQILSRFPSVSRLDMIEALPVPFGLVRFGVAPDHPEVKIVSKVFSKLASSDRFRFFGNVSLGQDISMRDLIDEGSCDAVVLAYGASNDRLLGIPGEDLSTVVSARDFVSWYNAYPKSSDELSRMDAAMLQLLTGSETAVVLGNGNVALDCARMLLVSDSYLSKFDCPPEVRNILSKSTVRKVHIVGRRGPVQSSFTNKELREIVDLATENAFSPIVRPEYLQLNEASLSEKETDRAKKRQWDLWKRMAASSGSDSRKTCEFHFQLSPTRYDGSNIYFRKTELQGKPGNQTAVMTNVEEKLDTSCVLRSIGYMSMQVDPSIPFDNHRKLVPNEAGYVSPHIFVSGWLKRGPSGIIGTNKFDAEETVETMGLRARPNDHLVDSRLDEILQASSSRVFSWSDVLRILSREEQMGYKIRSLEEMEKLVASV